MLEVLFPPISAAGDMLAFLHSALSGAGNTKVSATVFVQIWKLLDAGDRKFV